MSESKQILKKKNLRVTAMRQQILDLMLNAKAAVSQKSIESDLKEFDRITLYRTLKSFEEKGIIHKIEDGTGLHKFAMCADCDEHHHHDEHVHFNCNQCGDTFCLEEMEPPSFVNKTKHRIEQFNIVLKGTCEMCLN